MSLFQVIQPELILIITACALFLMGVINRAATRRACAVVALAALAVVFFMLFSETASDEPTLLADSFGAFRIYSFAVFIKALSAFVGAILILLAWPTDAEATGNSAMSFGTEAGEFYGLMLLAISGVFVVAGANDLILLFLGVELASIPTYIMVSVSRPVAHAQEAGVKYFFLGALAAALLLFGLSYLYGTTGITSMSQLTELFSQSSAAGRFVPLTSWQVLAVVMIIAGLAFKLAAVPLHFYAGDVYQGAATPVTAFLSYVPKAAGLVALLKVLFVIGGSTWAVPPMIGKLIWVIAALTMTFGNLLGLRQQNVKRMLAYSSVAHSGYLLVGVAALVSSYDPTAQQSALRAILFYLAAYGIMNAAAFGVLMLLPAKPPAAWDRRSSAGRRISAETLEDLAGAGIKHVGLGLAMAVACFSLIGLPFTVGFFGKLYLIRAAWIAGSGWLVIVMMVNAAISAGYYLRIVATMFLRPEIDDATEAGGTEPAHIRKSIPIVTAIGLSCACTLLFGTVLPATELLETRALGAAVIDRPITPGTNSAPVSPTAALNPTP